MNVTFSELRKKDVICIGDGRLLGRVADLQFDQQDGRIRALILPGAPGLSGLLHGEKSQVFIPIQQIACIGDDVVLVSASGCC